MQIVELSPVCGVDVRGLDLRDELQADEVAGIRRAFLDTHLLLVRRQDIDDVAQARFLSHLGTMAVGTGGPFVSVADYVSTEREDDVAGPGRMLFHVDRSFQEFPPYAISMYALKLSGHGAPPTTFANAAAAYRRLPDDVKAKLDGLRIVNLFDMATKESKNRTRHVGVTDDDQERYPHATHPAVMRLPFTGTPVLLVNQHTTSHFVGMDPDDSEELYQQVLEYLYAPDNVFRHDWELGDVVVWNNHALHHGRPASVSEGTYVRELRRMIVGTAA